MMARGRSQKEDWIKRKRMRQCLQTRAPCRRSARCSASSRQVEEFLATIFYHLLQTNPKQKAIVIVESFYGLRSLTEAIGHCCFKSYGAQSLYFCLGNATPLYTSGMDSGVVIDMGYQQV